MTVEALLEGVLRGDARILARAATLIENDPERAVPLLKALHARSGGAEVFGLTGAPGAGKSTLTAALLRELRREGRSMGVLAVDPSSPFSGGALLGDRIRMTEFHGDPHVFIRSMATRGQVGGLAGATADVALLLDAAGYETILVETAGVGQDEVEVAWLAAATAVVLAPGLGDDVQAMKAGLLEIADVFVLNKADLEDAARLEREMRAALDLAAPCEDWTPPLIKTVATRGEGAAEVLAALRAFLQSGCARRRAPALWAARLRRMYAQRLLARLDDEVVEAAARRVAGREADPYTIMEEWLAATGRTGKERTS